jgi:hypothetical protein
MGTKAGGMVRVTALGGLLAASLAALSCGDESGLEPDPPLARGTIIGSVTGAGGAPLDSIRIGIVRPAELALYDLQTAGGSTDAQGEFSFEVDLFLAPDPQSPPDTLAVYVTATALPPRYTPPAGDPAVRDSVLVPVALAASGPVPVTEVHLALPVAPVASRRWGGH